MSAYFKQLSRHNTSAQRQEYLEDEKLKDWSHQRYLEGETRERQLARDTYNIPEERVGDWGAYMTEVVHMLGNDTDYGGKKAVLYQEFVISPNPKDSITLDELRELACSWAEEWFVDGTLGNYMVAIDYHNDNKERTRDGREGIMHAHVHVANTDLATSGRLHLSNQENRELRHSLQHMCGERGLSHFSVDKEFDWSAKRQIRLERAALVKEGYVLARGKVSWKEDLRDRIEIAMRTTRSMEDYVSALEGMGVGVEYNQAKEDCKYQSPWDPEGTKHYRCYGYSLGASYSLNNVRMWQRRAAAGQQDNAYPDYPPTIRDQIVAYVASRTEVPEGRVATLPATYTAKDVVQCLRTNDIYGITCVDDYRYHLAYIDRLLSGMPDGRAKDALAAERAQINASGYLAQEASFFKGLSDRQAVNVPAEGDYARAAARREELSRSATGTEVGVPGGSLNPTKGQARKGQAHGDAVAQGAARDVSRHVGR